MPFIDDPFLFPLTPLTSGRRALPCQCIANDLNDPDVMAIRVFIDRAMVGGIDIGDDPLVAPRDG